MRCNITETRNTFASLNRTLYNAGERGWLVLATAQRENTGKDGGTSGSRKFATTTNVVKIECKNGINKKLDAKCVQNFKFLATILSEI